jgi:hypothetical protein
MSKPSKTTLNILEDKTNRNIEKYETSITEIGQQESNIELQITQYDWPKHTSPVIKADVWVSYTCGVKWHHLIGFETNGSNTTVVTTVRRRIKPQHKNDKRLVKVIIDCRVPLTLETKLEVW